MTLLDTLLGRRPQIPQERALVPVEPDVLVAKAITGPGAIALAYDQPLWSTARTPQKMAAQALATYHVNDWVRLAERTVSGRAGSVEWHLEDDRDEEVTDDSDQRYLAIRQLLERPQAALDPKDRQSGVQTRRGLWTITHRHMGLAGTAFWYLDQTDALSGTPAAIMYIRPDRMFPVVSKAGNLLGWTIDKSMEEGGQPLELENVLPFYLEPPDEGHFGIGLIESIGLKASLGPLADRHIAGVLASGGRLAGMLIQKPEASASDEQWAQFVRDFRGITEDPNAARRLQILKVPAEYVKTAATLQELDVKALAEMAMEQVLTFWGVPRSQVGSAPPAGLNSGSTKGFDEAILWQGAVHPRLQSFWETVQYGLLDRFTALGTTVELVLDEPEFDDDSPQYAKAVQAQGLPLTNDERREIVGMPPLDPAVYQTWGQVVLLPSTLTEVAGPGVAEKQAAADAAQAAQLAALTPPAGPAEPPVAEAPSATVGKAKLPPKLAALRRQVDTRDVSRIRGSLMDVLEAQKSEVIGRLQKLGLAHLKRRRTDTASWWTERNHDKALDDALEPTLSAIVQRVAKRTQTVLAQGKAVAYDDFTDRVVRRVLTTGAGRVRNINRTTRDAIQQALVDSLQDAETIGPVIDAVRDLSVFGELRAETIARTESMFAYNDAALGSYQEMGVEMVEAIDGDDDEECAARDGQPFTVEEAMQITDHPNGTLDWAPVIPDEAPAKAEAVSPVQVSISNTAPASLGIVFERNEQGKIMAIRPQTAIHFQRDADGHLKALVGE